MSFQSKALSSQGARIQVETGAGTPLTITAITKADPANITSGNALVDGAVVRIAAVVGMTEINGQSGIVDGASATEFDVLGVDSSLYTTYVSGGTATPVTFGSICEAKTFQGFDGQASEIDVSTMCSDAKEYRLGLQDFGTFSFEMNYVPTDPTQLALQDAKSAGTPLWFQLLLPDDEVGNPTGKWVFKAFVRQFSLSGGVDATLMSSVALRITGEPAYIEP